MGPETTFYDSYLLNQLLHGGHLGEKGDGSIYCLFDFLLVIFYLSFPLYSR